MTRNDRQREIVQLLNGADVALDSIEGPDGQGPYVPGVDFPGGSVGGNLDADTVASKDRPVVDVTHEDFGAVGDGSTDDQAAIQAAIDHAAGIAPATVYIPPGRYVVGDPSDSGSALRWTDDVVLEGAGMFSTIIDDQFTQGGGTATGEPRFIYAGGTDSTQGSRVGVRNLGIENTSGFDANTISLEEFNEGFVENVFIDNTMNSGSPGLPIALGFDEEAVVNRDGWVRGCIVRNALPANKTIQLSGIERAACVGNVMHGFDDADADTDDVNGIGIISCDVVSVSANTVETTTTGQPAIQILGSQRVSVTGNTTVGGGNGIVVGSGTPTRAFDARAVTISGNYIGSPGQDGVKLDSPTKEAHVSGNIIDSPGQDGISNAAIRCSMNNNHIHNPGRHGYFGDRGSNEFRQETLVANIVRAPADIGIVTGTPGTGGGVIALNHVSNIGNGGDHIQVRNTNGDPSDFVLLGNNCTRGGTGITVQGTPSNFVQANNNA